MPLDLTCNRLSVRDRHKIRHGVTDPTVDKTDCRLHTEPTRHPACSSAKNFNGVQHILSSGFQLLLFLGRLASWVPLVEDGFPQTIYQARADAAEMHPDLVVARLVLFRQAEILPIHLKCSAFTNEPVRLGPWWFHKAADIRPLNGNSLRPFHLVRSRVALGAWRS